MYIGVALRLQFLMAQGWEIDNFLDVRGGALHMDGVSMPALASEYGTPLFVFSESLIRRNVERIARARDLIGCPLKICYAAKANSTMAILRSIRDAGCDIEVNSGGELWKALEMGFRGDQIIFNGTSKEIWEIENAVQAGIYAIQVDSLYELSLIDEVARRLNKTANVSLRLVPEIETGTHSGLQTALLTSKFGMMPDEAFAAFRNYKDSARLVLCGIHLHIGSQNPDPEVYTEACEKLFECLVRIHQDSGKRLKHINLGGGFPVNYLRSEDRYSGVTEAAQKRQFEARVKRRGAESISAKMRAARASAAARHAILSAGYDPADALHRAWNALNENAMAADALHLIEDLTLLLEPGRSIIADAGICLTTVRNVKQRPLPDIADGLSFGLTNVEPRENEVWLLTDAGFNILLSMETYKWYYDLISAERTTEPHNFPYKVGGPLCDGGDVYFDIEGQHRLPPHRTLPDNVGPGEVLALLNCGAYSLSQGSQYNGRFLPAAVLVRSDGKAELIRSRDSFEDLTANDIY